MNNARRIAREIADRITESLKPYRSPERAEREQQYLKSDLTFLGATLPDIRRVTKSACGRAKLDRATATALAEQLWRKPIFEYRMAAVIVLERHAAVLAPEDLPLTERLIRDSRTWALVDGLAANVVGDLVGRHGLRREMDRWARDPDFWVRRSSLLAEMKPLKQGASFEPFAARADALLDEKEFFIRKAIGWVLRETSKTRPDEVYEWIAPRTDRASGVTMRETVKYLDAERAERLMQAYRERRPTR
ncbi:MAG TPA: DNA alkylation repair protein [Actinomycetes bacterium]|nr:DNA alkylation repair protein [Actinomycetes bacterium]